MSTNTGDLAHFIDLALGDGDTPNYLAYTALITYDDGTTAAGTIGADTAGDGYQMSVTATYPVDKAGAHVAAVDIADLADAVSVQSIIHVHDADLEAQPENQHTHETKGQSFNLEVACFTFADSEVLPSHFTAMIYWGGDSASPTTPAATSTAPRG